MLQNVFILIIISIIFYIFIKWYIYNLEEFDLNDISVPVDITIDNKYKNAYYYEINNNDYTKMLHRIFNIQNLCKNILEWSDVEDSNIIVRINAGYQQIYEEILEKLKIEHIDIIYNKIQKYNQSDGAIYYKIDMILYRKGKMNGKHTEFIVKLTDKIEFLYIEIKGIVNESYFYMHPIEYNDNNKQYKNIDKNDT
jgi:hypothetical protein